MKILALLNSRDYPALKINIISNGTLFTPGAVEPAREHSRHDR